MTLDDLLAMMTQDVYDKLVYAVETGKWLDGSVLSQELRDTCVQAMMLYQSRNNTKADHMTVAKGGELSVKTKQDFKADDDSIYRLIIGND